ncbi:MAG: threonine/serine exporter family protein [Clostridium sp.]
MSDMSLIIHFVFAFFATVGFSIFLSTPKEALPYTGVIGAIGWVVYVYLFRETNSFIFATFVPAIVVSIISEILARYLKKPSTVFLIPGIIPLVPGLGMYKTMLYIVEENYSLATSTGVTALFSGGAISLAILLVVSIVRIINIIKYK